MAAPEFGRDFWKALLAQTSCRRAFQPAHKLAQWKRRQALDKKMDVIFFSVNLDQRHVKRLADIFEVAA